MFSVSAFLQRRFGPTLGHMVFIGLLGLLCLGLLWPIVQSAIEAVERIAWYPITGDEAFHSEVVEVLKQTGQYRDWKGTWLVPALTTGPVVVLPAALVAAVFDLPGALAARWVVFGYWLLGWIGWFCLARSWCNSKSDPDTAPRLGWLLSFFVLFLIATAWRGLEGAGYFSFGVMGEGPALTLVVWAAYFFNKINTKNITQKSAFPAAPFTWAFAAAGLGGATFFAKTAYFCVPLVLVGMVILHWRQRRPVALGILAGGVFLGVLLLLALAAVFGFAGVVDWLNNYWQTMRSVNHAGLPSASEWESGVVAAFLHKLRAFGQFQKPKGVLIAAIGGLALLVPLYHRIKSWREKGAATSAVDKLNKNYPLGQAFVFGLILLQGFWWWWISPGAESRYWFPVAVLLAFSAAVWVGEMLYVLSLKNGQWFGFFLAESDLQPSGKKSIAWAGVMAVVIAALLVLVRVWPTWTQTWGNSEACPFCRELQLQAYWKGLPAAQKPTQLWSTSQSYDLDLDLVLSAPFDGKTHVPEGLEWPKSGWILVGEVAAPGAIERLKTQGCRPVFTVSSQQKGFWTCGE